ncbi:MAG TPA: hypothetical protein PLS20_07420 [Ruminococcus flavefaciens]|nr:hypothetical protein [Ruminococcus flavefaciens]
MATMGRPRKEINETEFAKLCRIQCTLVEIADFFDCSEDTIQNWVKRNYTDDEGNPITFSALYKRLSAGGKRSLRRYQFDLAKTNATMAIWLGKQWLNQKDSPQAEDTADKAIAALLEAVKNID